MLNLKHQALNGVFWTFIDILINKGSYFIATIVLAGILGPSEFGYIGLIMLFVSIGNTLIDSGMSTSLLRKNNITENEYSTVYFTNILMSFVVYLILYLTAPLIANFYNQALLIEIIRWYCLGFIISSFRSIHNVKLIKEMKFRMITLLNLPGALISLFLSVWMGYKGCGIWSLVSLFIVNQSISTILYLLLISWRPKYYFDLANYREHFNFGYKLVFSALLNTVFENIYNILIGKFFNLKTLGLYERAYSFNNYPVSILSGIILKVSLPSLSTIKNDSLRLQKAYKSIMQMSFLISSSGLAFAALLAHQLVSLFLGAQWLAIVPLFQILSISFIFYPIHSLNINILSVFGRSDLFLRLEIVKKIIIIMVVLVCFNFGVMGLVWSSVINSVLALIINTHYSGRFLNYPTKNQLLDLLPTLAIVLLTIIVVYSFQKIIPTSNLFFQVVFCFLTGFFTLIVLSEKMNLKPYLHIKSSLIEVYRR